MAVRGGGAQTWGSLTLILHEVERVTEDKTEGLRCSLVLLWDCSDRRLHPRAGRSVGARSKEDDANWRKGPGAD